MQRFALAALLLAAFSSQPRADEPPLSLDEATRLAEAESPAVVAGTSALESAVDLVEPAGALPDPQLIAGVENLPVTGDDAFDFNRDFMTMRKLGLMQDFPGRRKRELRTQRAQADAAREQARLTATRLAARESVARAWIARASAERRLELLRELEPNADAQVAAAIAALAGGRGSAADGIAAKAARAMLDDRIDQARREVDESRAELARWLPDAAERPLGAPTDWSVLGSDPDTLLARAARHRELLAYEAGERAAATDVELARAEKHPDWSVELAYAQRGPDYSDMVTLEFRVGLPLFARGRQDPAIASKQAALAQLQAEREDASRMRAAELRKAMTAWRSALERSRRYERELLPLSEERAAAALAGYRGGRGDLQSALAALGDAIEQRLAYSDLQNTLGQAWATLRFAFPREL